MKKTLASVMMILSGSMVLAGPISSGGPQMTENLTSKKKIESVLSKVSDVNTSIQSVSLVSGAKYKLTLESAGKVTKKQYTADLKKLKDLEISVPMASGAQMTANLKSKNKLRAVMAAVQDVNAVILSISLDAGGKLYQAKIRQGEDCSLETYSVGVEVVDGLPQFTTRLADSQAPVSCQ